MIDRKIPKEHKLNKLLRSAIDAMYYTIITDEDGYIMFISPEYAKFFHINSEVAVGKYVKDVIPNSRMHIVAKTGKAEIGDIFKVDKNLTVIANRIPIFDGGEIIGVISTATFKNLNEVELLHKKIDILNNENINYKQELQKLRGSKYSLDNIIGISEPINKIKDMLKKVSDSNLSILFTGETGTGKEVFANAVHQLSKRSANNFIKINCAAIPKDLLESELFGYEEGAFSGALKGGKVGKFELANKGTILLDEIGEMPLSLQAKLLRVLQEKELERVGGLKPIKIDVRVVCNTNKNIEELVAKGDFREDLYYRINVVEINIPPLRERIEDIPCLSDYFIKDINLENGIAIQGISKEAIALLQEYSWTGNIRELKHTLERACVVKNTGILKAEDFDFFIPKVFKKSKTQNNLIEGHLSLENLRNKAEREEIIKALIQFKGNKSAAAKALKIDRSSLYDKIRKYEIEI